MTKEFYQATAEVLSQDNVAELERLCAEAERQKRLEEYEAQMKALKPGAPWPSYPVVGPEMILRPALP